MGRLNKPKVDFIKGLSPAIAVEQKVNSSNPRSTVGTRTEIYDYLKLLFARIGRTYSPISGLEVKKDVVSDVVDHVKKIKIQTNCSLAPIKINSKTSSKEKIKIFKQQGFARIYYNEKVFDIDDLKKYLKKNLI